MKKVSAIVLAFALALTSACALAADAPITVISREDGSGTRGAFIELTGVEQKDAGGNKIDMTTDEAIVTNSTSVMLSSVAGDGNAIGYVSLGSLNETVKALEVDGNPATAESIVAGAYALSRPFNIVTVGETSEIAQDFMAFILSAEGQAVVVAGGYIAVAGGPAYTPSGLAGQVVVGGSSSVAPVMEKLSEAYMAANPGAKIVVQQSDSTTGITSAIEGIVDIGMASRALKDSEIEKGALGTAIALDGIAVIVNLENERNAIATEQIAAIFTGEVTDWNEVR